MKSYSLTKGLSKGLVSVLTIAIAGATFAGLTDLSIWDLIVEYVKPIVGSLTVGGLLTIALNWVKFRTTA